MKKLSVLQIRLSPALKSGFEQYAKDHNISASELIRRFMIKEISR